MDLDSLPSSGAVLSCTCACPSCCLLPSSYSFPRSVKRKLESPIVSFSPFHPPIELISARIEVENEVTALREALVRQQQSIQELCLELDEERNAASTAASEAMSMILRLQREKAEIQMESRQFKRFAEERMNHDQQELIALDDLLFKREQALQLLACQLRAYKDGGDDDDLLPECADYPPLKCDVVYDEGVDIEKYTPRTTDHIQSLKHHIKEMEKEVVVGGPESEQEIPVEEEFEDQEDDGSYRVYTVDSFHRRVPSVDVVSNNIQMENGVDSGEIKSLYARLQALEADRESMRQTLMSMRTEKTQVALLKEIAQQLCKGAALPEEKRVVVKKPSSLITRLSIVSVIKWILSFIFWRRKASRSKYTFGLSNNNVGLLLLLDKSPHMNQWRSLTRTSG